jgi:hypothetical protein
MCRNCRDEQRPTSALKPLSAGKIPLYRFLNSLYPRFSTARPIKPAVCRNRMAHRFGFAYSEHTQTPH